MITEFTQVDEALIEKLKGLQLPNEENVLVDVPVVYIDPEEEFTDCTLPAIAVYRNGIYPHNLRWDNSKHYDNPVYDANGKLDSVDERNAPDPYNVYYGIRIYYQYQIDGALMNRHINKILRRGAYLTVGGDGYDIIFVSYKNPNATYKDFGSHKKNEVREFVEQYLYKVEIELDISERRTTQVTKETPDVSINKP